MKITNHFDSTEFDCHDGTSYPEHWHIDKLLPLCKALEKVREAFDSPIKIHSGFRTQSYNKQVGGATHSQHVQGNAADFSVKGIDARKVIPIIEKLIEKRIIPDGGLGSYAGWVHYDQRPNRARWRE